MEFSRIALISVAELVFRSHKRQYQSNKSLFKVFITRGLDACAQRQELPGASRCPARFKSHYSPHKRHVHSTFLFFKGNPTPQQNLNAEHVTKVSRNQKSSRAASTFCVRGESRPSHERTDAKTTPLKTLSATQDLHRGMTD